MTQAQVCSRCAEMALKGLACPPNTHQLRQHWVDRGTRDRDEDGAHGSEPPAAAAAWSHDK